MKHYTTLMLTIMLLVSDSSFEARVEQSDTLLAACNCPKRDRDKDKNNANDKTKDNQNKVLA